MIVKPSTLVLLSFVSCAIIINASAGYAASTTCAAPVRNINLTLARSLQVFALAYSGDQGISAPVQHEKRTSFGAPVKQKAPYHAPSKSRRDYRVSGHMREPKEPVLVTDMELKINIERTTSHVPPANAYKKCCDKAKTNKQQIKYQKQKIKWQQKKRIKQLCYNIKSSLADLAKETGQISEADITKLIMAALPKISCNHWTKMKIRDQMVIPFVANRLFDDADPPEKIVLAEVFIRKALHTILKNKMKQNEIGICHGMLSPQKAKKFRAKRAYASDIRDGLADHLEEIDEFEVPSGENQSYSDGFNDGCKDAQDNHNHRYCIDDDYVCGYKDGRSEFEFFEGFQDGYVAGYEGLSKSYGKTAAYDEGYDDGYGHGLYQALRDSEAEADEARDDEHACEDWQSARDDEPFDENLDESSQSESSDRHEDPTDVGIAFGEDEQSSQMDPSQAYECGQRDGYEGRPSTYPSDSIDCMTSYDDGYAYGSTRAAIESFNLSNEPAEGSQGFDESSKAAHSYREASDIAIPYEEDVPFGKDWRNRKCPPAWTRHP